MRNTDRRGITALLAVVIFIIAAAVVLMRLNQQPRVTPASSTGSMQGQLSPQTNPKH